MSREMESEKQEFYLYPLFLLFLKGSQEPLFSNEKYMA